jgi:CubicO group peptidase (beta-lactamase class C family)
MKRFLIYFFLIAIIVYVTARVTGYGYIFKAIWYNFADVDDYKIFNNRTVATSSKLHWYKGTSYNNIQPDLKLRKELEDLKSLALVVVRNDSMLYEEYWEGYKDSTISGSFSVAKSIVSILTGIALQEGKIHSLDDKVYKYVPSFNKGEQRKVSIRDLLTMTSGTNWNESYINPFSMTTRAYYGNDLAKTATAVSVVDTPGTKWIYKSGDYEILSLVIESATGKTLSDYASEKIWKPLNAEQNALWSLDDDGGIEKAYCCFNATARDFARVGDLYLHNGKWKGTQLVNEKYVKESVKPVMVTDDKGKMVDYYGFGWWLLPDRPGVFYARGILGQYVIVIPKKNAVVVRLGNKRGEVINNSYQEVYDLTDWILKNY